MTEQELIDWHEDVMKRINVWRDKCYDDAEAMFGLPDPKQTHEDAV